MLITTGGTYTPAIGPAAADGADCAKEPPESFYRDDLAWDFDKVWKMETGDVYPTLQWQQD